jgi:hypothetical protein
VGDWFQSIVDPEAAEAEASALADRVLRWLVDEQIVASERIDCVLSDRGGYAPGPAYVKATGSPDAHVLQLRTNGLGVVSTRTVFHNGGLGFEIVCAACSGRFEPPRVAGAMPSASGTIEPVRGCSRVPAAELHGRSPNGSTIRRWASATSASRFGIGPS